MKKVNKLGTIIAKILEVFHWVGAALMLAASVCAVVNRTWVKYLVEIDAKECCGASFEVYGFEVNTPVVNGNIDATAFALFGIGSTIILVVMAMVFRNLHLILKKSQDETPFQKDNVRMMKEIGIFAIAVPIIGLIVSILIRVITGVENVEITIDMEGILLGIIILCLTQYFVHGMELEEDVDGLL